MPRAWLRLVVATTALLAWSVALCRADVTIAWDPVLSDNVSGYNVYYGTASHAYSQQIFVGNTNLVTVGGLRPGTTYYFAVTVVVGTLESGYSDEIVFAPSITAPAMAVSTLNAGQCTLTGAAPAGHRYDVLATTNFIGWQAIGVLSVGADQTFSFVDPAASAYAARFYLLHDLTFVNATPSCQVLSATNGAIQLRIQGLAGHTYNVVVTHDLITWTPLGTLTLGLGGSAVFTDPDGASVFRFYGARDASTP